MIKATTLLLCGLLSTGMAVADEPQQARGNSGMKVGIDPKTGKLRPLTAAESAKLDAMAARNQKAAVAASGRTATMRGPVTRIINGLTITEHDESFMVEMQATRRADGKIVLTHQDKGQDGAMEAPHE